MSRFDDARAATMRAVASFRVGRSGERERALELLEQAAAGAAAAGAAAADAVPDGPATGDVAGRVAAGAGPRETGPTDALTDPADPAPTDPTS